MEILLRLRDETNSLHLEKADSKSWWMKRGSGRDSWRKGKTRKAREEESPNVVLHICFITGEGSNTLYIISLFLPLFHFAFTLFPTK